MRWSYKTVRFDMKKEGLLGSAFLDESEIELSLNEFGEFGWELISLLEVQDGIIGVFKQPFAEETLAVEKNPEVKESEGGGSSKETEQPTEVDPESYALEAGITREWGTVKIGSEQKKRDKDDSDIGSIRIE